MPVIRKVDGFVLGKGMIEYDHSSNIKISDSSNIYKDTPKNDKYYEIKSNY